MRCRSDARENAFETSLWRECVAIGLCRHKRPELDDMTAVHVSTDQEGHAPVCCRAFDSICHRVLPRALNLDTLKERHSGARTNLFQKIAAPGICAA